jgi:hypothetical protein
MLVIQAFALPPIVYAMLHILVCFDRQRIYSAEIHVCGISDQWPFRALVHRLSRCGLYFLTSKVWWAVKLSPKSRCLKMWLKI